MELATAHGFLTDPVLPFFLERYAAAYRAEFGRLHRGDQRWRPPRPDGEDGLRALLLAEAAEKSARERQIIRVTLD